jgi:hypothetical protein
LTSTVSLFHVTHECNRAARRVRLAAGLVALPWEAERASKNPQDTVLRFGDAVYAAAVKLGGGRMIGSLRDVTVGTRVGT